jgi:hypothetical protein
MSQTSARKQGLGTKAHWLGMLDQYRVRYLLLDTRDDRDLVKLFRSLPGWDIDFEDQETVLFMRNQAVPAGI